MTTETAPAPDPVIHDWSENLEEELVKEGMEPPQAKVFARAFELGMMRVMSVVATKQELLLTKQELKDGLESLRRDFQRDTDRLERVLYGGFGLVFGGIIALLVRAFG